MLHHHNSSMKQQEVAQCSGLRDCRLDSFICLPVASRSSPVWLTFTPGSQSHHLIFACW
jgi:hypothetical protein